MRDIEKDCEINTFGVGARVHTIILAQQHSRCVINLFLGLILHKSSVDAAPYRIKVLYLFPIVVLYFAIKNKKILNANIFGR